ncbi:MAG: DUF192 domain-containing protein [Minwuiales bacterium]|nr:DUF192 domain-containing protein [Minwuiales bacterium]
MKHLVLVRTWLLGILFAAIMAAAAAAQSQSLPVSELRIATSQTQHFFKVEVADNDETRARGLMFRMSMPPNAGMLFDYRTDQQVAMWMKNTFIPLDILFIDRRGKIVNIHERAVPLSLASIPSDGPVRAALELNGGSVSRLGIKPGDQVFHALFAGK